MKAALRPACRPNKDALEVILSAIEQAGYKPGEQVLLAIDAAATELYQDGKYHLAREGLSLTTAEMVDLYRRWVDRYPMISLEDGMAEDDWDGWKLLPSGWATGCSSWATTCSSPTPSGLHAGSTSAAGNSILVKVNQIGTLTETLAAIEMAKRAGFTAVVSHRSGETEDTTIADIVVATNAGQIKTGAPSRSERVAKYNRLLRIDEELDDTALYLGREAFYNLKAVVSG